MIAAAVGAASLCLVALASARLAIVLRARQPVAARLSGRGHGRGTNRRGWRPPVAATAAAGWLVVAAVGALVGGRRLLLVVAVAAPAVATLVRRSRRSRARRRYEAALPAAMEEIARGLRSGASLLGAMREAGAAGGPVAGDLERAVAEADTDGAAEALDRWGASRASSTVALAAAALALAHETGGPQAATVDSVADGLRQRLAMAADLRAAGAQARISAMVMALAPAAFAVTTSAADPRFRAYLFDSRGGTAMLLGGLGLDAAGAAWMARITRMAL